MTERMQDLIDRREDAQSQLDALCGECPEVADKMEKTIAGLTRLINAGDYSPADQPFNTCAKARKEFPMIDYVTSEIGSRGTIVLIEPEDSRTLERRVFKYLPDGSIEWAYLADWRDGNERTRFYGWHSRELPASMTCE